VKPFVSLQILNLRQLAGLLGRGISPTQGRYLHRTRETQNNRRHTHTLGGIRTHNPNVRAGEDISYLRPRGHCDRLKGMPTARGVPKRSPIQVLTTPKVRIYDSLTHSWSRVPLEKPPIVQLLENFPAFYGTRRFITAFT
jgi:hypothetical protein